MNAAAVLLSLLIPAIVVVITVLAFRPLLRGYREEVANERRTDDEFTRWAHPVQANKRLTRARWFIAVGYTASILWLAFSILSSSQRDAAGTVAALLLPAALVGINIGFPFAVRAPYAKGQTPSWRRIAMFTLVLWATFLAFLFASGISPGLSAFVLAIALVTLPTLLWFPVWLLIAYAKQHKKKMQ